MLKQSKAKRSSRRISAGTVIFEGLKRTTLGYRAYAYDVATSMLVSLNNESRPCWCRKSILRELNSLVEQKLSFISLNKYGRWSRDCIRSIQVGILSCGRRPC